MELVKQRTDCDCTVACLATYSGRPYEEVITAAEKLNINIPMTDDEQVKVLKEFGYKPIILTTWVWQAKGILTVPSLNFAGKNHVVCWTGNASKGEILDPQTNRDGKKFYTTDMLLNGNAGWSCFIADINDDCVEMFAKMEIEQLQTALRQNGEQYTDAHSHDYRG